MAPPTLAGWPFASLQSCRAVLDLHTAAFLLILKDFFDNFSCEFWKVAFGRKVLDLKLILDALTEGFFYIGTKTDNSFAYDAIKTVLPFVTFCQQYLAFPLRRL